ncbi:hypothetical protein BC332_33945 [Capsicum chinense]|nr:hypothetical protein BC332_33945 [Capsicum chinense]
MAEILLTAVINKAVVTAGNRLIQEGTHLYSLKEDIDWLQREMRHIQAYIDDAKAKATEGDSRMKILIKDIQELAGDVEDLLDEFLPKIQQFNKCKGAICCCLKTTCIPSHASFADEFAMEIEKIKKRVVDIDRVRTTYNIMDTSNNNNDCIPLDRRRLFLYADETEVIGLDDDFNVLQAKLLDQGLPYGVVSIVGMPGLGKTTLAKKLYRHVRDRFECSGLVYVMNDFFRSNPKPKKLRALFCFIEQPSIFSLMAHLEFKLLQVLVVVVSDIFYPRVTIPNIFGNMSCLRYLRLERLSIKMLNSVVKLKCLETLYVNHSMIFNPLAHWESKQLRHLLYGLHREYFGFFTNISKFCRNNKSSLPNNLQTLMWLPDRFFQPRLLHLLINLRKLGIYKVSDSTIKMLSVSSPVTIMLPNTLEILKLYFSGRTKEQINLSCYQNVVKLHLRNLRMMPSSSVALPPNLVKLTLVVLKIDSRLLSVIKKLPKLRILTMYCCGYNEGKMDLSSDVNGDSFPQLEVLHFVEPDQLSEVICTHDFSVPKLNKVLLDGVRSEIRLSERLASTLIYTNLEINTNHDSEQVQPDLWTATADAKDYIEKLYNHYADLFDLAVPTNITPTVAPHPPEEPSSSKRPAHSGFSDLFYDLNYWNSVDERTYTLTYREELKYYLRTAPEDLRRRINTLDWWRSNETQYPVLSRLARDILNVPMSTVASESAFSQGRQQLGDNRHSLGSNAMNVLVCLRDWIRAERRNQGMEPEPSDELKLEEIMTSRENSAESSPMHGFAPVDFDYPMQVPININMNELEKMMHNL